MPHIHEIHMRYICIKFSGPIHLDVTIQKLFAPLKNVIIHFLRIKNLFPAKGFLRLNVYYRVLVLSDGYHLSLLTPFQVEEGSAATAIILICLESQLTHFSSTYCR